MATITQTEPVFHDDPGSASHDTGVSSEQLSVGMSVPVAPVVQPWDDSNVAFLQRDTLIASRTWTPTDTNWQFDPYDTLIQNEAVAQRLNYMSYLDTGGLKLTIRINGSPYYPGRIGVCWAPRMQLDYTIGASALTAHFLSTRPSFMMIDTTKDATYEMVIPQVLPTALRVDTNEIWGRVIFFTVAPLRSISSSSVNPVSVDISVFAAMIKPVASGKTYAKSYYGTSGEMTGKLSGPLKRISGFSQVLNKTPVIGHLATGIGMAASLGSDIASKMGFSKQPDLRPMTVTFPRTIPELANSVGLDPAPVLNFDPAVTTTLDTSLVGYPAEDELAIARFTRSWSLCYTTNNWSTGYGVGANVLTQPVTATCGSSPGPAISRTSLCFATDMHRMWTGSLEFRFTIPVTKFHTGRCQFYYVPSGASSAVDVTNLCYNVIMDLSVSNTVTMVIPFTYSLPWVTRSQNIWGTDNVTTGTIYCKVLNTMRAGGGHADTAPFIVEVRGGEDFQLAEPTVEYQRNATLSSSFYPEAVNVAYTPSTYSYYGTSGTSYAVAEPVYSFREHLKRYSVELAGVVTGNGNFNYRGIRDYPVPGGFIQDQGGIIRKHSAPFSHMTALMGCFTGMRGGTRHMVLPSTNASAAMSVSRALRVNGTMLGTGKPMTSTINWSMFYQDLGGTGSSMTYPSANNRGLSWSVNAASARYFQWCYAMGAYNVDAAGAILTIQAPGSTNFLYLVAAADDFNFIQFKGIPYVYHYGDPVTALLPAVPEINNGLPEGPTVFELEALRTELREPGLRPPPLIREETECPPIDEGNVDLERGLADIQS